MDIFGKDAGVKDLTGRLLSWVIQPTSTDKQDRKRKKETTVIQKVLEQHYFNHKITIFHPSPLSKTPPSISEILNQSGEVTTFYRINTHLTSLLSGHFLETYIQNSHFTALSINTPLDHSNTVAFLPNRHLILTIDKDTKEQLGLPALPCSLSSKKKVHCYVVTIDLRKESFHPKSASYQRVHWGLGSSRVDPLSFVGVCTSSSGLPVDITFPEGVEAFRKNVSRENFETPDVPLPVLHPQLFEQRSSSNEEEENLPLGPYLKGLYTWMGLLACRMNDILAMPPEQPHNDFLSKMTCPGECFPSESHDFSLFPSGDPSSPSQALMNASSITGLISAQQCTNIFGTLNSMVTNRQLPWAILLVQGFEDAPVSFGQNHHSFVFSGENDYAIFLLPEGKTHIVFTSLAPHDSSFGGK